MWTERYPAEAYAVPRCGNCVCPKVFPSPPWDTTITGIRAGTGCGR
jgi:hypothetical protein